MVVCCCLTQIIIESTALKHRMNFYCLVCRKIRHRGHNLTQLEVSFELRDKEFNIILDMHNKHTKHSFCEKRVYNTGINAVVRCCCFHHRCSHSIYFIIFTHKVTETHETIAVSVNVNTIRLDTN